MLRRTRAAQSRGGLGNPRPVRGRSAAFQDADAVAGRARVDDLATLRPDGRNLAHWADLFRESMVS